MNLYNLAGRSDRQELMAIRGTTTVIQVTYFILKISYLSFIRHAVDFLVNSSC